MTVKMSPHILLGYKTLFPNDTPHDKEHYARKVGAGDIELGCSYFLSLWRVDKFTDIDELLKEWFTYYGFPYGSSPSYHVFAQEIKRLQMQHPNSYLQLISPQTLLNILTWVRNQPGLPKAGTETDGSRSLELLRLILVFNDELSAKYAQARTSAAHYTDHLGPYRELFAMQFPQWDINNTNYAQLLKTQVEKLVILLDFMSTHPDYQPLHTRLLRDFQCTSNEDFIRAIGTLLVTRLQETQGRTKLQVPEGPNHDRDTAFLDKLAIQPDQQLAEAPDDYKELRSSPLIKNGDGTYEVLFDPFLMKKVYTGLVFLLSSWCPPGDRSLFAPGDFLGRLKEQFCEEHLLYEILKDIYNAPGDILITGSQFKAVGMEREPDSYVRRGNEIMLFESKDVFMTGTEKLSYDFDTIVAGLQRDGRFGKAVKQLATNVGRVLTNNLVLDTAFNPTEVKISPVLLVHDALYSAPLFNYWVNQWFQQEINAMKAHPDFAGIDFSKVRPVTVVEVDSLLMYQAQFKTGAFDFFRLMGQYHVAVDSWTTYYTKEDCQKHAQKQLAFATFLDQIAHSRNVEIDLSGLDVLLSSHGIEP